MKYFNTIITLIIILLLYNSCKKDEIPKPEPDSRYPYTYKVLSQTEWENRNSEFAAINNHDSLYLNKYGFMEGKIFLNEDDSIFAEFVIQQTELTIEKYGTFMGIPDGIEINVPEDLTAASWSIGHGMFTGIFYFFNFDVPYVKEYSNEPLSYYFALPQEQIEASSLKSTQISMYFHESDNSMEVFNNWYPAVFIPEEQIYTKEEALQIASKAFNDYVDKTVWSEDKDGSSVRTNITVYPLKNEDKIELREIWDIRAEMVETITYHQIYIDTQTGEIIKKWSDVVIH